MIRCTDSEWKLLSDLIQSRFGIRFDEGRRSILEARLLGRLETLKMRSYSEYYRYLCFHPNSAKEFGQLSIMLTNNESYFFREAHQFNVFVEHIVPALGHRSMKILSAGCSSGQEPYSIAITLRNAERENPSLLWEILACDMNQDCLDRAEKGEYDDRSLRVCDEALRGQYFEQNGKSFILKDRYRKGVRFVNTILGTANSPDLRGPFDVIFCRNMLIYFSEEAFHHTISYFWQTLAPDGYLLLGHSESLIGRRKDFVPVCLGGSIVYQKGVCAP